MCSFGTSRTVTRGCAGLGYLRHVASYEDLNRRFGPAVRARRVALGLSQDELAERVSVRGLFLSQAGIGKLERGERKVTLGEAFALADALGIELEQLVESDRGPAYTRAVAAHTEVAAAMKKLEGATEDFLKTWSRLIREAAALDRELSDADDEVHSSSAEQYLKLLRARELPARDLEVKEIINRLHEGVFDQ